MSPRRSDRRLRDVLAAAEAVRGTLPGDLPPLIDAVLRLLES